LKFAGWRNSTPKIKEILPHLFYLKSNYIYLLKQYFFPASEHMRTLFVIFFFCTVWEKLRVLEEKKLSPF